MTPAEMMRYGRQKLEKAGITEAGTDTWYLLAHCTGMTRAQYILERDKEMPMDSEYVQKFQKLLERRAHHEPLQYLTGSWDFMGYTFCVTPDVLIPRQDTELLAETVQNEIQKNTDGNLSLLDLCTGSGCIGISLKCMCPQISVTCSDISDGALAVAEGNAKSLHAEVNFVKSDLFQNIHETFDMIVSNPPYISGQDIDTLMPEVRKYEPRIALDGGEDGLDFYRRIIRESSDYLHAGGRLFLEIGCEQREEVREFMQTAGFTEICCRKDLAGKNRVMAGMRPL